MNYFKSIGAIALTTIAFHALPLNAAAEPKAPCCREELPCASTLPDKSLYHLTSTWTNDAQKAFPLSALHGRPQIVTMFFASCEFACPLLVSDMKRIEAALPENIRTNVGFVLVSFDSTRDTPEALAEFRKLHRLEANYTLLRGAPDDVQELAALLGVKYKKDQRGQFAHSNIITLLDGNGEVVTRQLGLNQSGDDLAVAIQRLVKP